MRPRALPLLALGAIYLSIAACASGWVRASDAAESECMSAGCWMPGWRRLQQSTLALGLVPDKAAAESAPPPIQGAAQPKIAVRIEWAWS